MTRVRLRGRIDDLTYTVTRTIALSGYARADFDINRVKGAGTLDLPADPEQIAAFLHQQAGWTRSASAMLHHLAAEAAANPPLRIRLAHAGA